MNTTGRLLLLLFLSLWCSTAPAQSWQWTWTRKVGLQGLNDPFCANPLNQNTMYGCAGNNVLVVSRNRGRTWSPYSQVQGGNQIKAIEVSARDSSVLLVAQEGETLDRVMKSTNGGATWLQTLEGNFYYFGHPLAYEPLLDDETVYTMASNVIYKSTDFGSSWDSISTFAAFGSGNPSWEDALVRPDSSNVLFLADNGTGIWKSTNHGTTWRRVHATTGEIPAIALNRQNPAIMYATRWGGGGGFVKSTDYGESWNLIPQFNGLLTWGVDVSPEYPDYVAFGTWGPSFGTTGGIYVSRNAGTTWERTYGGLTQMNNHAVFILDTMTVLSLWGNGIWKLGFPGTLSGTVFFDENSNGVRDSSELALSGWTVRLTGAVPDSAVTDGAGRYTFPLLGPGTYNVAAAIQQGWSMISPASGSFDSLLVSDGEKYEGRDFALSAPAVVVHTVTAGWNLLSLPVTVADRRKAVVFPEAVSPAYAFSQAGYFPADSLQYGRGYWMKFPSARTLLRGGGSRDADTIAIYAGWNLIGSISSSVDVQSIIQEPPGILASGYFGYADGVYASVSTIDPMRGYWVKAGQQGLLILDSGDTPAK